MRAPILLTVLLIAATAGCDASPRRADAALAFAAGSAARAPAGSAAWSAPRAEMALSDALGRTGRHGIASVAVDGRGMVHAVFGVDADGDGRPDALQYARLEGGAWSAPQPVATTLSLADAAQVAVDGDGAVHVVWLAHAGAAPRTSPTEVMHRVLRGGGWSAPRVLYHEANRWGMHVRWLAAATDARGEVRVLFAPEGRGFGHLRLRGGTASEPAFLDHDGNMMAFSASAPGAPLEMAYIGERVSRERPRAANDVFVRPLSARGAWGASTEAYYGPDRFSHYPQLVIDRRGVRHLFWLEDVDGSVNPEAVYASTSADGVTWSRPVDVTPVQVRGGVPLRLFAAIDGTDRIHLLVRYATAGPPRVQLAYFSVAGGRVEAERTLARAGEIGPGEAQLAYDRAHHRLIALWRGGDGVYRTAERATDG